MDNFRAIVLSSAIAVCALPVSAADKLKLLDLNDEILSEPRVTAEAVFVGLVRLKRKAETQAPSDTILAALPPADRPAEVCVRVTTEDGLYSGNARYLSGETGESAMTLMDYVSDKQELRDYSDTEVAVLTFPCDTDPALTNVAVATWRANDASALGEVVTVYVNSFRADAAFLVVNDTEQVDCSPREGGARAAFDYSCPLNASQVTGGARVTLYRMRGASIDPAVSINIVGWE